MNERGFSLVECMVSLVLACLGALAICKLQVVLLANAEAARQQLEASHLAQQKLEELRALPYDLLAAGADPAPIASNASYVRWWSSEPDPSGAPFQQVTVNLSWKDRSDRLQTLNLTSVIARKDLADIALLSMPAAATATAIDEPRHASIPLLAVNNGNGTSTATSGQTATIYDNVTGAVLSTCSLSAANGETIPPIETMCVNVPGLQPSAAASSPT